MTAPDRNNQWLHRFALLTAAATLALLGVGGLVTSHEAGMAVQDWPTSYGYNMFALPFKFWKGGALYEHSHRLVASGVGLLTTILAAWLWLKESRRWMRWLGVIAFCAVVLQGVLGGLRVVLDTDELGIFHATLAQLFFVLTCALALFTSRWWRNTSRTECSQAGHAMGTSHPVSENLRRLVLATTAMVLLQLVLGATMRHQHAGLAIPDFPLAYGKLWPPMDADSITRYNQQRIEVLEANPITAFQIGLQMAHRLMALLVAIGVGAVVWQTQSWSSRFSVSGDADNRARSGSELQPRDSLKAGLQRLALVWLGLILIQVGLGAWTIWSNKAADVATGHVLVGALSLVTGALWCLIAFRRSAPLPGTKPVAPAFGASQGAEFDARPALAASE